MTQYRNGDLAQTLNPFGARTVLQTADGPVDYFSLERLGELGICQLDLLPTTIKVLLEMIVRQVGNGVATEDDVVALAQWGQKPIETREFSYTPARVLLQDFTGVPAVVDLAAMRSALARVGADPSLVDPLIPVDLVIDHSVQVDSFGTAAAFDTNVDFEYHRNRERYGLLRWAQQAFAGFRVVPPGMGIVHQVNLEYLAQVVFVRNDQVGPVAFPDTLVGTDSHTPMVNGLGVLGWGVGGIEAEAAMLGQPIPILTPTIVGVRLTGALKPGITATDLVLTVTELLRKHGVVGKFVEFFGDGVASLTVPDRATLSNMTPEYGATACLFPVDEKTLDYLLLSGRDAKQVDLVETYMRAQGLFGSPDAHNAPVYSEQLGLDLASVEASLAGPSRPQDRTSLARAGASFQWAFGERLPEDKADRPQIPVKVGGESVSLTHGSVVIAAITSCTNTSNPAVMVAAGLVAKKARERGLSRKPWVKTSLAPGSRVVTDYLDRAGLTPHLEALGFYTVGYGCTTCIGNSGPLPQPVADAIDENDLIVVSVLSGNRNFEGRIHPQVHASYLASPPLCVAYALAGHIDVDLTGDPLGTDFEGKPVMLADIWPSGEEVEVALESVQSDIFKAQYAKIFDGEKRWHALPIPEGSQYDWDPDSTYVQEPAFFGGLDQDVAAPQDITGARVLALLGDSVTTDHISPAGAIHKRSPAGQYLIDHGVEPIEFNSYGSRRGNHEVMIRGTFANIRLRNQLVAPKTGGFTRHMPSGDEMTIFEAAQRYRAEQTPLVVIAGKEYGSGSSRDWAAKGSRELGIRAVIAESFERIHRSNLVGMGILPLQFMPGATAESLGLDGSETYTIMGISSGMAAHQELAVIAERGPDWRIEFPVEVRIDSDMEVAYFKSGGVLQYVLRQMMST